MNEQVPNIPKHERLREFFFTDAEYNQTVMWGHSTEECLVSALVRNQNLMKRVAELEAICPKKMQMPDGKIFVWQCPHEMIPITPWQS